MPGNKNRRERRSSERAREHAREMLKRNPGDRESVRTLVKRGVIDARVITEDPDFDALVKSPDLRGWLLRRSRR